MPEEKRDYTLSDAPKKTREQEKQEEMHIPAYMTQVDLNDKEKKELMKQFNLESDAIEAEWQKEGVVEDFDSKDNQYEGDLAEIEDQQFNLHTPTTKVKVDTASSAAKKAFLQSDPMFSVTPRPEFAQEGGDRTCKNQQEYLDYKLDEGEIPFKSPLGKVIHSAAVKGIGILKIPHAIKREKRKRQEYYKGTPIYLVQETNEKGQALEPLRLEHDQFTDYLKEHPKPDFAVIANKGLEDFLSSYPDAEEKHKGYVKKLAEGKEIEIIVEYEDTTYNDPLPKNVKPQNFRCRLSTDGYEGLKTTRLLYEIEEYTWWELKKEEESGKFFDIDDLKYKHENGTVVERNGKRVKRKNYENETFEILEAVFYHRVDPEDEEETKYRVWIDKETKTIIGITFYPYYAVDCYYIPFYVFDIWDGFLQPGIAKYLTDTNLAQNSMLNFSLEGFWITNMVTPITKSGSEADEQFLAKEFVHGLPITAEPGDIDFLQKYMRPFDVAGATRLMEVLTRSSDDVSRISSNTTGGESQLDPNAPAQKTIALLKVSGLNIEDYIDNLLKSFNEVGKVILQLTYQMSKEGKKYKIRGKGADFGEISRPEMIARTNIQSQAKAFDFDELNTKRELMAFYQGFRQEPVIAQNPEGVYMLMRTIVKKWSPMFRNIVDDLLPAPEEFKQEQLQVAVQAMAIYVKGKLQQAKTTNTSPEFDLDEIVALIAQAQQENVTPPSDEVVAEREKEAKSRG